MKQVYQYILQPATATTSAQWIPVEGVDPGGGGVNQPVLARTQGFTAGSEWHNIFSLLTAAAPTDQNVPVGNYLLGTLAATYGTDLASGERAPIGYLDATGNSFDSGNLLLVAAASFGYDATLARYQSTLMFAGDSDGLAADGTGYLASASFQFAWNGSTYDRVRTGSAATLAAQSSVGAQLTTQPGDWSVNHNPAANTQATITRAAGAAGVRHVCTSISCSIAALTAAAEALVSIRLRDGASGAGTILWELPILVIPAGQTGIALSNLNIVGSAATAMTLEFSAAGGADTTEGVSMTGHDAS